MVQKSRILNDIRKLSASPRNSAEDPSAHVDAGDWIAEQFSQIGLDVSRQLFEIPEQNPPRTGTNVIGLWNGRSAHKPILIGAHYDTVKGSPGADDNASGVAAMLECARILAEAGTERKIVFAAFDAEELQSPVEGLHGSTAYVSGLSKAEHPSTAIILESIGYSSTTLKQRLPGSFRFLFRRAYQALKRRNFEANSLLILSKGQGRQISKALESAAESKSVDLPILPLEVPWWMPLVRNLRRSDHAPFWQACIPAVMISDTANFRNPNYHRPEDTADTIDPDLVASAVKMILRSLESGSL